MAAPLNLNSLNETQCLRWVIANVAAPPNNLYSLDAAQCLRYMAKVNLLSASGYAPPLNLQSLDSEGVIRHMIRNGFFGVGTAPANLQSLSEAFCWRWVVFTFTAYPANLNSFDSVQCIRYLIKKNFFVAGGTPPVVSTDNTLDLVNDGTAWRVEAAGASATIASTVSGITAGNLLFVQVKCETNTAISTVTDNSGSVYTLVKTVAFTNVDGFGAVFVCLNALAGITTITATFAAGTATFRKIQPMEYACFTTPVLGNSVIAAGSSAAPASGNLTTSGTGFVAGFYFNYNSVAVTGPLNGAKTGVNCPEVNTTFMQAWGTQRASANETIASSCTLGGSGVWICAAVEIRGTGARTSTANNYAHGYLNFTGQADATQLSAANLASSQSGQGNVAGEYSFLVTNLGAADLTVKAGEFTLNKPLIVLGVTKTTAAAHKGFGLAHVLTDAPTYIIKNINRHRRIRVTGFIHLGPTNGGNTSLFDYVSIHGTTNVLNVLQLNCTTGYNLNCESIVSGGTQHSTGFTPTSQGSYSFCFWLDTQTSLCALKMWDISNVLVLNETPSIDPTHIDIDVIRLGNAEVGTEALRTTVFEHIAWNFDTDDLSQP